MEAEGDGSTQADSEEDDSDRRKLRMLLRKLPAEDVREELEVWLREGGPGAAAVKQLLVSAHKTDSRAQRGAQMATPCVRERDDVLSELRERNKIASNVGFDIIMRPLEEKAAEERKDEVLTDLAWLQLVRAELGPALQSSTLSRVSRDRRQVCDFVLAFLQLTQRRKATAFGAAYGSHIRSRIYIHECWRH